MGGGVMRRLLVALLALPLLLLGADYALWRYAERQLAAGLADWESGLRHEGWSVQHGKGIAGGFPFAATLYLPDMAIAGGLTDLPGGLAWSAARTVLRIGILRPRALVIGLEGAQTLRLGHLPPAGYSAAQMHVQVPLDPAAAAQTADLVAVQMRGDAPGDGQATEIANLAIHTEARQAAGQGEAALSFTAQASGITLPKVADWPLGPGITQLECDGAIDGPLPRAGTLPARLGLWRDGGGSMNIQRLALEWGPLALDASATLALDEQLQPMGAASVRAAGWSAAIDAMAQAHTLAARTALAVKAVLALMARAPDGGGAPEVEVPLSLQDRALAMGRIPLLRLPTVNWSSP